MALRADIRIWLLIGGLSLGPAVSNGFARFAYGLILPAMRDDLGWNFTQAGWINTANAVGYLIGALLALGWVHRFGPRALFVWGMALTTVALAFSAMTRDIWLLGAWRIVAGIGGAPAFIAGGVIASGFFAGDQRRNALAVAVYFGGGGTGMLITALTIPPFMTWFGTPGWPLVWLALGIASYAAYIPAWLAAERAPEPAPGSRVRASRVPARAMVPAIVSYFLFGLGYLIYITFLIAFIRARGAGPGMVATTWAVMSIGVILSPFLWRGVLAKAQGGLAMSLTNLAVGIGILMPLVLPGNGAVLASAALVGGSFFMVPSAATTFCRKNLPAAQWGPTVALLTTVFAVGQIVGPVGAGAISDATGGTGTGLAISGAILITAAAAGALQRPLDRA